MSEESMQMGSDPVAEIVSEQNISDAMGEKLQAESGVEAPQEESQQENAQNDKFAEKFAALSRKEKEIRARQAEIDAKYSEYEAWKKEQEELANQKEPEIPLEYRLRKNPIETLAEMGLSYEKLTEIALNDGKLDTLDQMDLMRQDIDSKWAKKFEELENKFIEKEKAEEEARYEKEIQNFNKELTNFVNENSEYELIRANDAVDLVYNLIESHYAENQQILSTKDACDAVEAHLEGEIKKLAETNKLKGLFQTQEAPKAPQKPASPTLSNDLSSHTSTKGTESLSDDESKAIIAQMLKWDE